MKKFRRITLDVDDEHWPAFDYVARARGTSRQAMIRGFIANTLAQATPAELGRPEGVLARCLVCGRESLDQAEIGSPCGALLDDEDTPCAGTLTAIEP